MLWFGITVLRIWNSGVRWYEWVNFWEFWNLFRDKAKNYKDDSYWKHLTVSCVRIDITITDSCDCYNEEVEHVVEIILFWRNNTVIIVRDSINIVLFSDFINFSYVIVFNGQHYCSKNVDSCEECENKRKPYAHKSHTSSRKYSVQPQYWKETEYSAKKKEFYFGCISDKVHSNKKSWDDC